MNDITKKSKNKECKNIGTKLKRNCPKCNKILIYKDSRRFKNSSETNKLCQTCSRYGNPKDRKIYGLERNCPRCNKILKYSSPVGCYMAKRNKSVCNSCNSSLQMKNKVTKRRRIKSLRQVKHTWHDKIAKNRKINGTYEVSEETREKHRINKINRMIEDGTLIWPNYNRNACKIFDKIEIDLKLDGMYASKGKEKRIGRFWVDYYEPNKNIVIEYDEPYHFDKNGELKEKDKSRQKWITNKINCKFYRIQYNTKYNEIKNIILRDMSQ